MKIAEIWQRVTAWLPWKAARPRAESLRMDDGSFAAFLEQHGGQRGVWSEITYFTCLKMLAETLAKMPIKVFKEGKNGVEEVKNSNLTRLLKIRPNPYMTPTVFWNTVEMNRNHYGNGYVYIQRKFKREKYGGQYETVALWIMPSDCVTVYVDNAGIFAGQGKMWYGYTDPYSGKRYIFGADQVIHVKTSHTMNGITGLPVQQILRETVRGAAASQKYMNALYEQGMTAKAALEYTGQMTQEAKEALRQAFEDLGSGTKNAGRIIPVPLGMKLTPMDFKLTDAQFYELKKYSALQIAGAFGVKPNQLNDYTKSSYSNSEMQQLAFYVDTELFILKQYEEEIGYKLMGEADMMKGKYVKFNEKVLLRTDNKTQMESLAKGVQGGIYMPDEARGKLDMPRAPGGDQLYVNGSTIPLIMAGKTQTKPVPEDPEEDKEDSEDDPNGQDSPDEAEGGEEGEEETV